MIDGDLADYTVQQPSTHAPAGPAVAPESPPAPLPLVIGCLEPASDSPLHICSRTVRAAEKSSTKITHHLLFAQDGARADYVDTFVWMTRVRSVDKSSVVVTMRWWR